MSRETIHDWLINLPYFNRQLRSLTIESVLDQFPAIVPINNSIQSYDWNYLLFSASVLANSANEKCQDAALRIAQHCLVKTNTTREQKHAAVVILDELTNRLAINLAEGRELVEKDAFANLPYPLKQDSMHREMEYSVRLLSGETLKLNRFQKLFWHLTKEVQWASISAPTSAGKSYVIKRWLEDHIRRRKNVNIVYLVPTRALIQEVEGDLKTHFKNAKLDQVLISSMPKALDSIDESNIFVFTQERYHLFLSSMRDENVIDLLIIDEAQKLSDGYRGVLLHQVVEETYFKYPKAKIIFASPLTENPEDLLKDAPLGIKTKPLISEQITVNQNLLWLSQERGKPKKWMVSLSLDNDMVDLGAIDLLQSPSHASKRLTFIAHELTRDKPGSIIYVNGAADAEKAALQLYDLVGEQSHIVNNAAIQNLTDLIKKTIHKDYGLAQVLTRGIAFHYGNMPLLVRLEIERLFKDNVISYLVCTSTLLEGVNLPCQTIFARGPQKGRGIAMSKSDFWNLAGRAGRWGKEFQGNIVCIDPERLDVWKDGAPKKRVRQNIKRTTEKVVLETDDFYGFIKKRAPRDIARKRPDFEYVLSYLIGAQFKYGSINALPWVQKLEQNISNNLGIIIEEATSDLDIPFEIIWRNPGISPFAMSNLLNYFKNRQSAVEELLPVAPESDDAVVAFNAIFCRVNKYLSEGIFGYGKRSFMLSILVTNWMRGYSLARLISDRIVYSKKHDKQSTVQNIIRETMNDVEQVARFAAPKYVSCYLDLLRFYLTETGQAQLLEPIDFHLLLEFGVSQPTQLALISLGLSRTSTIAISELISDNNMTIDECLVWLEAQKWDLIDIPVLVKTEIKRILESTRK